MIMIAIFVSCASWHGLTAT